MTKIFVSYSRVDTPIAELLIDLLQRHYRPENVWYDQHMIGGVDWWQEILHQIDICDVFVYLLSNDSVESPYCRAEFTEAQRLGRHVVTVQVRDRTKIPPTLRRIQYVEMSGGVNNAVAMTELYTAINYQASQPRQRRAHWRPATPNPDVPTPEEEQQAAETTTDETLTLTVDRPLRGDRTARQNLPIIASVVVILIVVAIAGTLLLGGDDARESTPTPDFRGTAGAEIASEITATHDAANTATQQVLRDDQLTQDANQTATQNAQLDASRTAIAADATLTEERIISISAGTATQQVVDMTETQNAINADNTATQQAIEDATATQQALDNMAATQAAIDATATATLWTDTPTNTLTPSYTPTINPSLAQDGEPQYGGTLYAAFQNEWAGLDPHTTSSYSSYQILNNVLEGLTSFDDELNLQPWLAESWEQSEDGKTWTFHLREGVLFSDGREMTAEDVKWSFERLIDPETGSGNAARVGPPETQIEVIDGYTVAITHPEPIGIFPQSIGFDKSTGIMARESLEDDGTVRIPIGTGPFMITEVEGTTRLVMERNENYWQEGLPYLDAVEIVSIPDDTVRQVALQGGEVDWVLAIAPQNFEALDEDPDVVVATAPQLSYDYIGFNLTREPFNDPLVRQAIALALDREQLCEVGYFGLCDPLQGPIGQGSPWYFDYQPYDRDVERARELLAEAGYPDGFTMELMPTTQYSETERAAVVLQLQLAEIGITAEINSLEWSEWLEKESNFSYDAYIGSWYGLIDADQYYYLQHHTGLVFNFTGYSNEEFDALVEQGRQTSEFDQRYEIYEQANEILVDDAPYVYMYNKREIRAFAPYVKGFVVRPDQANNFWTVWLDQ